MYIGIGTLVVIVIIVLVILFLRRLPIRAHASLHNPAVAKDRDSGMSRPRSAPNKTRVPRQASPPPTAPQRHYDAAGLTIGQLERTRRELAASLALARPGSPARAPIQAQMAAIDTELAARDTPPT